MAPSRAEEVMAVEADLLALRRPRQQCAAGRADEAGRRLLLHPGHAIAQRPLQRPGRAPCGQRAKPWRRPRLSLATGCWSCLAGAAQWHHPVPAAPLHPAVAGLVAAVKAYELLTVEAAVHGDRTAAYEALIANPIGPEIDHAQRCWTRCWRSTRPICRSSGREPFWDRRYVR